MILKFSFDLLCITEVWGFAACPCQLNWANTSIFTTTSFSTVDFHAPSDPKLPLKPNTSTAATHWMCDKEDAARPAPSAFGSVTHQERKKKKRKWDRRIRKEERVNMFWSGVFAFLKSTDRLSIYSLTQNSFYTECFKKGAERSPRSEGGGMLAGYKWMLFCTYCLLHINICWVLSYSKNKPRRAGDSIWWLQAIFSFPGLAGDGHNSSWHNFMKFHSTVSLKERCHKQPQFLDNLAISWGGPSWPLSKAGSWDKNRIW